MRQKEPLIYYSILLGAVYGSIFGLAINHIDLAPTLIGTGIGMIVGAIIGFVAEKILYYEPH